MYTLLMIYAFDVYDISAALLFLVGVLDVESASVLISVCFVILLQSTLRPERLDEEELPGELAF